ncbi:hypothetical protein ACFOD0_08430 [Shewanella intestini]|uniref:Cytochrome c assembly protein domain-containing protein n=1 Tax=Shewanella intestini TaxID=2017544 RepID=A0ABS5HYQ9_9GAMM|nr:MULTISPECIES: hypothetical protein [Shewanella]MBR9726904.1 hypothetical protein [Shewanella intestini]MRG34530.1 hypothetical protein [Shewanella sp. XMDDZSB0408]
MFLLSSSLMMLLSLLPFKITDQYQLKFALIICFIVAVFLGYQYTFDIPTSNSAMLLPIWSQLFFLSRPVAVGFGIAACVGYLLQSRNKDYHLDNHCHMLSLLAGTAFLVGEVAGNFWAFLGWGKSWGWTGHFYVSALTYLLLVLVFHLPKAWFNSASRLALGKAVLLGFICLLILGYKFS